MDALKVGDEVVLNSGGPIMTLDFFDENGRATCKWFTTDHQKVHFGSFDVASLSLHVVPNQ